MDSFVKEAQRKASVSNHWTAFYCYHYLC